MTARRPDRPIRHPCPRCGALAGERCVPLVSSAPYPTIGGYHSERGMTSKQLTQLGYRIYETTTPDGAALQLWRRADQRPFRRN